ncbi:MAG TPA: ABC transporter ATP-binding protein, partial [Clostridiales bacterium]|nr:ABC transporter ATP-binding protein [Clostridiales bacterium]
MKEKTTAIELRGITKVFGTVLANDSIDLIAYKGEILALLGENGSGKTTLMNMLSGIYKPDGGEIFVNGQSVIINSPEDSKRLKIGMVYQHYKLVESFTAADNIWISAAHENYPLLTGERYEKIRTICDSFGFEIDPKKIVGDMAVSEKQTVEILKVLYNGADILILDEPTAVLTLQETKKLFAILRKMRDAGCAIIIITHKLNEVMDISDRVTILRKGKSVATVETSATTAKELTDLMMGHAINLSIEHPEVTPGEILLELDGVTVKGEEGTLALDNVSFELKSGEILGVAGVSGCGQKELCDAIAGLQALENGKILFKGESIEGKSPRDIIHRGISMSFIPEDRLGMGLAASLDITNNMMLKNYRDGHSPLVNRRKAIKEARHVVRELGIITPSISTPVRRLSGGNVQKVLLGREMLSAPQVMITAYPVRGLDINSSYTIYNILNREKEKGTGVLYVGEDLDVMLELCDRILVLCHGKLTGIVNARESSKEELGLLMTDANNAVNLKEDSDGSVAVSYTPP